VFLRAGDSARTKQVSSIEVATRHCVVSDRLSHTVVKVFEVRGCEFMVLIHLSTLQLDFQVNIVAAKVFVVKVGQQFGVLLWKRHFEWF